jgi:hypothetical protein
MHFARELVFWECREELASETDTTFSYSPRQTDEGPRELKSFIDINKRRHRLELLSGGANTRDDRYPYAEFYHKWSLFLGAYTKCHLTKGGDVLVALQGIVQDITEALEVNVISGMCAEFMVAELCWQTNIKNTPCRQPLAFSPSWSWISSTRPIYFAGCHRSFDPLKHCMASFVSAEVEIMPSGEPVDASLLLNCGLIPMNHHYDSVDDRYEFALDLEHVPPIPPNRTNVGLDHDSAVFTRRFQHLQCYFVPLCYESDPKYGSTAYGMTIVPSEDRPGSYMRVGYCCQYDNNKDPDWNKVETYRTMERRTITLV